MSVIRFRYKKNHMLGDLGDGQSYLIPIKPGRLKQTAEGHMVLIHDFDLDKVHEVQLRDITPKVPKRREEYSEAFYQRLVERAEIEAIERRAECAAICRKLKLHASDAGLNVIEIVEDPDHLLELEDEEIATDAEVAIANETKRTRASVGIEKLSDKVSAAKSGS